MSKPIVLTGASGFLGRSVLQLLADESPQNRFLLICRSSAAVEQVSSIIPLIGAHRARVVRGDVDQPNLGLGTEDLDEVCGATDLWHIAASTSFDDRHREAIFHTNVAGTRHVIQTARRMKHLNHLYHVSTAYVAGTAAGPIAEDDLPRPPGFRNAYEESKWEGEKVVRTSGLPFTIFRPSIIMGDSQTYDAQGETRMIYGYILGIYAAICQEFKRRAVDFTAAHLSGKVLHIPLRVVGHEATAKNFVCIDDVVRAIKAILAVPHVGRTFNLTGQHPITLGQIRLATGRALKVSGLSCGGASFPQVTRAERSAMRFTRPFDPYTLHSDPVWSCANTNAALHGTPLINMTGELFGQLLRHFVARDIMASPRANVLAS